MAIRVKVYRVAGGAGREKFFLSNPLYGCSLHDAPPKERIAGAGETNELDLGELG
jgi:hypothetical protein